MQAPQPKALDTELQSEPNTPLKIMIVTGEASGDLHAAGVLQALKLRHPAIEAFGMGGVNLRKAGMDIVVDSSVHASVMGFTEVFGALRGLFAAFDSLLKVAKERQPDVLLLLDFPDFNMRFLKRARKYCKETVYFIAPQVWAWRSGRAKTLKRYCSKIIPLFPFEEQFYQGYQVEAKWLGHPFLDHLAPVNPREQFLQSVGLDSNRPVLALLPGSRKSEIEGLAADMRATWQKLRSGRPGVQAIVPVAPSLDREWVESMFGDAEIVFTSASVRQVLHSADIAMVASGTATLEAALVGTPYIIVYRLAPLTYFLGKRLVRGTKFIGTPNILAGKEIVPELLQEAFNPESAAGILERYLADPALRTTMTSELAKISEMLRYGGTSSALTAVAPTTAARVADEILTLAQRVAK
jgi:lipid-A-disaccharide synthase